MSSGVACEPFIFGIRHHGPGSARSLVRALDRLCPDIVLIEGPPEGNGVLPALAHPAMRPPVALLAYVPDEPRRAVFYPFAVFSPEWQAARWSIAHRVEARFIDLPLAYQFAEPAAGEHHRSAVEASATAVVAHDEPDAGSAEMRADPLSELAAAAGFADGERWWEQQVEERRDDAELFAAVLELMTALRADVGPELDLREARREASMRQAIRAAGREGYQRIAVVCGAWHAPALAAPHSERDDARLLRGLPKSKVAVTWVPWTYDRLALSSGYGAGISAPGWYEHLWFTPRHVEAGWMARVAQLLRSEDLDASSAQVIEGVRLAEALAVLRSRSAPGLDELNEAAQAVFALGSPAPLTLIASRLIVGKVLGSVPDDTPLVPLQHDLRREQKRLRLPAEAAERMLDLDVRKDTDLGRSHLLHRLNLLGVHWGHVAETAGKRGTFHELWRLRWQPELEVALIDASRWGMTIETAAEARVHNLAEAADALSVVTGLVEAALLANLPAVIAPLMARVQRLAAGTSDVPHLMDALPPLATAARYGSVRRTDAAVIAPLIAELVTRIAIGLPGACAALNDEAARAMFDRLKGVHHALGTLQQPALDDAWHAALVQLARQRGLHGLIAGRCCRLLLERDAWDVNDVASAMRLALSPANTPLDAAAWIEGLLLGSGLVLLHNAALWSLVDSWVASLPDQGFPEVLPLLRRTFSTFAAPERRQMGERVVSRSATAIHADQTALVDRARADLVLPTLARLLGLTMPSPT